MDILDLADQDDLDILDDLDDAEPDHAVLVPRMIRERTNAFTFISDKKFLFRFRLTKPGKHWPVLL